MIRIALEERDIDMLSCIDIFLFFFSFFFFRRKTMKCSEHIFFTPPRVNVPKLDIYSPSFVAQFVIS